MTSPPNDGGEAESTLPNGHRCNCACDQCDALRIEHFSSPKPPALTEEEREALRAGAGVIRRAIRDDVRRGSWDEREHALWERHAATLSRMAGDESK